MNGPATSIVNSSVDLLFTTIGKIAAMESYPINFTARSSNTASDYDDDYPYWLLAPTMLTLLQQQPRGHQQRKQLVEKGSHWSGRPTLSHQSNVTEEMRGVEVYFSYHFQSHTHPLHLAKITTRSMIDYGQRRNQEDKLC